MKKKLPLRQKLTLRTETLCVLAVRDLRQAAGGEDTAGTMTLAAALADNDLVTKTWECV